MRLSTRVAAVAWGVCAVTLAAAPQPGGRFRGSPGRLVEECRPVENLVRWAYLGYPDGKPWAVDKNLGLPVQTVPSRVFRQEIKGPGWINSERYTIEAKAPGAASMEMMRGPMMQALLEDRFSLKVRIENREYPVYYLTVAEIPRVCGAFRAMILDRNPNAERAVAAETG